MAINAEAQKLSGNNFIIVMLLISLLVVGVSALVAKSLFTSISRDLKVVTAKAKADKQLKDDLVAAPSLVAAYTNMGDQATLLKSALPTTGDFPSLIVMLENMTSSVGMKMKSVAPSQLSASTAATTSASGKSGASASTAPSARPYPFSITFDGSYDALQKFFAEVETSARPLRLTGFQLNGSSNSLSGQIDLETYYQDKAQLPIGKETIR